jgi:acetolactate synthase-1/2/3 large subunit
MAYPVDGGEAVLEAFRNLGIRYIVSSPGSEWGSVWEAIARQKVSGAAGPEYLSCWHETLAVNIAMGYTLATGRMQAVMLHAGVGLLQGSAGIHSAHIQNVPMVVLSGESLSYGEQPGFDPGAQWYQNLSVVGGPQRLVEPYVKWAGQAASVDTLYESILRAGNIAQRTPAGPVYVNVPIETQLSPWTKPARLRKAVPFILPRAPVADIERVAALLRDAKSPVITTEAGGSSGESYAALMALAEAAGIPVVETPSSLFANFPKDHPLHGGPSFAPYFEAADLVLVVRSRIPWYPPAKYPPHATIVLIDENPYRPHMVYQSLHADTVLEGDAAFTLASLAALACGAPRGPVDERRARQTEAHAKREAGRLREVAAAKTKRPIHPTWLCAALSEALPEDTTYVDESVSDRDAVEAHLRNRGPLSFIKVRGALGQGLGHAIGVKLAMPGRTVVALMGDGTFLYNPVTQSLGYAAQAGLPIIIVVFNNGGYRAMRNNQLAYYPDGAGKRHGIFPGEPIGGPDYATLGQPFGCWGRRVEDPNELVPAIKEAHRATREGKTAILNVVLGE